MRKIGFIDLDSKMSGNVYVFRDVRGKYELENTLEFDGDGVSSQPDTTGISEFVLSLPVESLNYRLLKLPFSDKEKLTKVVPLELENLMLENPDDVVFDATVLGGAGDQFDVLAAYVRKGTLQEILAKLWSLGIDPYIVTCLDLQTAAKKGAEGIASWLMSPEGLNHEERIEAARGELLRHTLNLRTGPFAYTKDTEKIMRKLRTTVVLFFLLTLLVNSYLILKIASARNEASAIKRDMRNMYTHLFPGEKRITDELYQMKSHMKEIGEKGDALIGVYPLQFMLDLSRRTVPGVAVNEISLERDLSIIKGEASSMADVDRMKAKLSEFLANASVSDIKQTSSGRLSFTITAKGRK